MTSQEKFQKFMKALDLLHEAHDLLVDVDAQVSTEIWQAGNVLESAASRTAFGIKRNDWVLENEPEAS